MNALTEWGEIGGTLSDQTDLQAALDAKVDETTRKVLIHELKEKLQNLANETNFVKINDDKQTIEFILDEWVQLGN